MPLRAALLLSVFLVAPQVAFANTPQPPAVQSTALEETRLNEVQNSALLFKTDTPGRYLKAPSVSTDVDIDIAGPIIRTTLSQTFQNNSDEWVEGIYVFPLPENAAVDRLRMVIGGRFIEGQIKEKQQAKKIYAAAKRAGKRASLVEQERPNMFTASVANIGPRESISIQIEYQDTAQIKDGQASLVFPMTVAPRYSPPAQIVQLAAADGAENGAAAPILASLDPVLDRARITPPVMPPALEPTEYIRLPVSIDINLEAGFKLAAIDSPYHTINVARTDEQAASISLAAGQVPANRDFKLTWEAAHSRAPQKAVFKETIGQDTYLMTLFTPPKLTFAEEVPVHKRETIFVIDTSGSMGGVSIKQARKALKLGLSRLGPEDRFNVIEFNSIKTAMFSAPQPASSKDIKKALNWVDGLKAGGGTNMLPAMQSALNGQPPEGWLKQIIFITDGAIGNETQLFAAIQDDLKSARLFPVGIGSAPNRFFMSRAAKFGRGTSVVIGDINEVDTQMGQLFTALESPLLTNLQLSLKGEDAESYPSALPDLYSGQPVMSVAKINTLNLPKDITVSGDEPNTLWQDSVSMENAIAAKGLSVIWARRKIAGLEEQRFDRQHASQIDAAILKTALEHNIVSRLTSLVAVDITPVRDQALPLSTQAVPTQIPKGWNFAALQSPAAKRAARTASPSSAPRPTPLASQRQIAMPATASPHIFLWLLGLLMLGVSRMFGRKAC